MSYSIPDQQKDMRWWLNAKIPGASLVIDKLSHAQLIEAINNSYDGGFAEFVRVFGTPVREHTRKTNTDPQIVLRKQLREMLGRPYVVAACHEIIRIDQTDSHIYLVLRVIDEIERGTRLVQRGATIRRVMFAPNARTGSGWVLVPADTIEIPDPYFGEARTYVASYVTVTDAARYADKFWQYHECYRPGSEDGRAPMDGCYGPTRKDTRHDDYRTFQITMREVTR